jgi:hypothetical protein
VSPFGDPCSIAIMRSWKLVFMLSVRADDNPAA